MKLASHTVRIQGMSWENIRNFEEVSLPPGEEVLSAKKTSLVQIQNHYGKTSTMSLLHAVFTGMPIGAEWIDSYAYRNGKLWGGDDEEPSEFTVNLDLDGEPCSITLTIDPLSKTQTFQTYREDLGGMTQGWNPPRFFRDIFQNKPDFVQLFILDGEIADDLNKSVGKEILGRAIRQVSNINHISELVDEGASLGKISKIRNELVGEIGHLGDKSNRDAIEAVKDRRREIQAKRMEFEDQIAILEGELKSVEKDIKKWIKEYGSSDAARAAEATLNKANGKKEKVTLETLDYLLNPVNIFDDSEWDEIVDFYKSQNKAKLPKAASQKFFTDIVSDMPECICGTRWNDKMIRHVEKTKDNYLEEGLHGRVTTIQGEVHTFDKVREIGAQIATLRAIREEARSAEKSHRDILARQSKEATDEYDKLTNRRDEIKPKLEGLENSLECIISTSRAFIKNPGENIESLDAFTYTADGSITKSIPHIKKTINLHCLKKIEENLQEIILEKSESNTAFEGAKILDKILSESLKKLMSEIEADMKVRINHFAERIPGLDVEIMLEDSSISYRNKAGKIQSQVNEAGKLGAMYALVATLNGYADVELPIVVDTPLAGFGGQMTAAWVNVVIPNFDQVIALINGNEKKNSRFWWGNKKTPEIREQIHFFTFHRENEEIETARDPGDKDPTGRMMVSDSFEDFAIYETHIEGLVDYDMEDIS